PAHGILSHHVTSNRDFPPICMDGHKGKCWNQDRYRQFDDKALQKSGFSYLYDQ
ncbi:MAG TPA: hypothetical protein IAA99_00690, partial [Candidatus Avibacteroides faecavium]|nr:hypothetical protein [Candidatus Avibacteroides faecavium]